jgi:hypothetical protein
MTTLGLKYIAINAIGINHYSICMILTYNMNQR